MKPWQRIVGNRPSGPQGSRIAEDPDSDGDSRGAFDDLRRLLASQLEREADSPLLVRSSLERLLGAFMTRAQQRRGEIGLVAFELESWKSLQDVAGAQACERAVADLAAELRRRVRGSDDVGRLGEAQIAAVLPGCEEALLSPVSERLHTLLEAHEISLGPERVRPSIAMVAIAVPLSPTTSAASVLEALTSALDRVRGADSA